MIHEFCCHCFPWPWWQTPKRSLNVFHPFPFDTRVFWFGERGWLDYTYGSKHMSCVFCCFWSPFSAAKLPSREGEHISRQRGKARKIAGHRLWHRNGRMKPKNTKRSSMRSGSFLAGKNYPTPISVLVDPPRLGIGRVGGGFCCNQVLGIFWKWQKKLVHL